MNLRQLEKKTRLLIIYDDQIYDEPPQSPIIETLTLKQISELKEHENNTVLLRIPEEKLTDCVLNRVFSTCKLGGKVVATCIEKDVDDVEFNLKLAGFVNVEVKTTNSGINVFGFKPTNLFLYGICPGLRKRKHGDWIKFNVTDKEEPDQILDPDELLDEEDFKQPESAALQCGTTEKRKAEEVTKEVQKLPVVTRSSCGNVRAERDYLARPTWRQDDLRQSIPEPSLLCSEKSLAGTSGAKMSRADLDEPICLAPSRPR
ncbi:hypothetical protein Zmor_008135 [Zophobas morio]|uniref:Uncharacterized protein n=1 Tax=Zophobas morio TaxID=2755281 RepID=A0AA38IZQ6_9CUCU|nr:hypothetical protein Zmor_008135 [Zophobas morio]